MMRKALGAGVMAAALSLTACATDARESSPETPRNQETTVPPVTVPPTTVPPVTTGAAEPAAPNGASDYRDGEYSATGWYGGLPSHHDVTLSIENNTVTAVEITTPAEDETSLGYQQRFADALPEAIVGRNIDELAVDRLAGSGGCSEGFMDALAQIKEDARA